jgi:hypothetical protein
LIDKDYARKKRRALKMRVQWFNVVKNRATGSPDKEGCKSKREILQVW